MTHPTKIVSSPFQLDMKRFFLPEYKCLLLAPIIDEWSNAPANVKRV